VTQGWAHLQRRSARGGGYRLLGEGVTTLAEALQARGYRTLALTGGATLAGSLGFAQGFDAYREDRRLKRGIRHTLHAWLEGAGGQPFFVFFHTFEVHAPYPHTELTGGVLDDAQRRAIRAGLARRRADVPGFAALLQELGLYRRDVTSALYDGGIRYTDAVLGELLDELGRLGLERRTLVIFTSDHGEEFGDHDPGRFYDAHCRTVYEELIRVPLLLRLPGRLPAGRVVEAPVELVDVAPTVLDLLGIQAPAAWQGQSLRALAEGRSQAHKPWTLSECTCADPEMKALRSDGLKYVASYEAPDDEHGGLSGPLLRERAFDLAADPGERRPLPGPQRLARLRGILEERVGAASARAAPGAEAAVDADVLERLRALGYVE
jgi:arylsulfatase A-like enzyme